MPANAGLPPSVSPRVCINRTGSRLAGVANTNFQTPLRVTSVSGTAWASEAAPLLDRTRFSRLAHLAHYAQYAAMQQAMSQAPGHGEGERRASPALDPRLPVTNVSLGACCLTLSRAFALRGLGHRASRSFSILGICPSMRAPRAVSDPSWPVITHILPIRSEPANLYRRSQACCCLRAEDIGTFSSKPSP